MIVIDFNLFHVPTEKYQKKLKHQVEIGVLERVYETK